MIFLNKEPAATDDGLGYRFRQMEASYAIGAQVNQRLGIGNNGESHVQEYGKLNGYRAYREVL